MYGNVGHPLEHRDERPDERFARLYETHYPLLLAYVWRRTDSPDDAADALAETFVTAWRKIDDVPPGEQARLWLYGVARRVLANHRRGAARRTELAARLRAELTVWSEEEPADDEFDAVREAFARLRPGDRELLSLIGWENLGTDEISVVFGCSRAQVRLRLHRARKRLARELDLAGVDVSRYGARAATLLRGEQ
ncbi:RNA polymerase sigma factor [Streptosporangiaceae bacterium NEAU-GS5]|nr:RNA polymerase sigma factor [Streptosporangiaceae bacterium NEAU-GS5]